MSSLKEIKGRIASVKSTQKITAAMKMVASAKLRKAQYRIERFLPYENRLTNILNNFLAGYTEDGFSSPLTEVREIKRVAIVVLSSNSSLCGAFNSNIIRILQNCIKKHQDMQCEMVIYPIGKKVEEAVGKLEINAEIRGGYIHLIDKPAFEGAKEIADSLIADFLAKKIDRVELIYNHFKNTAIQIPTEEQFLPIDLSKRVEQKAVSTDYIIEPDRETLLNLLIPGSLRSKIYAILLDSSAAEQAARTVAMQIATDNADEILDDLTVQYNKQRQQAITSELLDIIGGSEALK
ncbi:MAG: F0F1 ATP synthase subunit gamma [Dysgonamonadaceae bacterium]|jgi:F-type H+-transporting ATPase subunit gamma|nr:F0F1 ATP synthase subunit gamma [Dysgonamonadaceae bacterium]